MWEAMASDANGDRPLTVRRSRRRSRPTVLDARIRVDAGRRTTGHAHAAPHVSGRTQNVPPGPWSPVPEDQGADGAGEELVQPEEEHRASAGPSHARD